MLMINMMEMAEATEVKRKKRSRSIKESVESLRERARVRREIRVRNDPVLKVLRFYNLSNVLQSHRHVAL